MASSPRESTGPTDVSSPRCVEILVLSGRGEWTDWPEPLPMLAAQRRVRLTIAGDVFEAARRLRREAGRYAILLIDADAMARREVEMLATIKRHVVLPLWSLPTRNRGALVSELGILRWEEASRALLQKAHEGYTRQPIEGNKTKMHSFSNPGTSAPSAGRAGGVEPGGKTDNRVPASRMETPVVSRLAAGYDELNKPPLLSPQEREALLGPVERSGEP